MSSREVRELAARLARLERAQAASSSSARLANSSLEDTGLPVYDAEGNLMQIIGRQPDGSFASVTRDGPVPPVPSTPSEVAGGPLSVTATWDGGFAGGVDRPGDFAAVEVWAAEVDFDDLDDARLVAPIASAGGGQGTGRLPVGEWHVALVTRALSGKRSAPSERVAVEVTSVVDQAVIDELNDKLADMPNITWDAAAPTMADGDGKPEGAVWRQVTNGAIVGEWEWTGTAWEARPIADDAIVSVDVGKLTASSAEIAEAVIAKLWVDLFAANKVTAAEIDVQDLWADAGFIGELNSATIIGAIIKTAATGMRVELDSANGIRIFNDAGEAVFNADGAGNISLGGTLNLLPSGTVGIVTGSSGTWWSDTVPVTAGRTYRISGRVFATNVLSAQASLSAEFDTGTVAIVNTKTVPHSSSTAEPWSGYVQAPEGATTLRIAFRAYTTGTAGPPRTVTLDRAQITEFVPSNIHVSGSVEATYGGFMEADIGVLRVRGAVVGPATPLTSEGLNDLTQPGTYEQATASSATTARNYPEQARGTLTVVSTGASNSLIEQCYTTTGTTSMPGNVWVRTRNTSASGWAPWILVAGSSSNMVVVNARGSGTTTLPAGRYDYIGPLDIANNTTFGNRFIYRQSDGDTLGQGLEAITPGVFRIEASVRVQTNERTVFRAVVDGGVRNAEWSSANSSSWPSAHISHTTRLEPGQRLAVQLRTDGTTAPAREATYTFLTMAYLGQ